MSTPNSDRRCSREQKFIPESRIPRLKSMITLRKRPSLGMTASVEPNFGYHLRKSLDSSPASSQRPAQRDSTLDLNCLKINSINSSYIPQSTSLYKSPHLADPHHPLHNHSIAIAIAEQKPANRGSPSLSLSVLGHGIVFLAVGITRAAPSSPTIYGHWGHRLNLHPSIKAHYREMDLDLLGSASSTKITLDEMDISSGVILRAFWHD